jgi:hypothetical protein
MPTDPHSDHSIASMFAGIMKGAQTLISEHLALVRAEFRGDLLKAKQAAITLSVGAALLAAGGYLLCLMVVYILAWSVPQLPLWACEAIVGVLLALVGAILCYRGKELLKSFEVLPTKALTAHEGGISMDDDVEMIQREIGDTRAGLTDRASALEKQVMDLAHDTTAAVKDVVHTAKDAVTESANQVQHAVHETTQTVKQALDLKRQVERHPLAMFGAFMAVGYLTSRCLEGMNGAGQGTDSQLSALASSPDSDSPDGSYRGEGAPLVGVHHNADGNGFGGKYATEIGRLRKLAISTALSGVRDYIAASTPEPIGTELSSIIDSLTLKLGGKPIPGPIMSSNNKEGARVQSTTSFPP